MKTTTLSTLISMLLLSAGAHAEISGSGSPNVACAANLAGVLWHDLNGDGIADAGEPGLPGISLQLFEEDGVGGALNATTDATGNYQFGNLCEGEYLAVINESTVPDGLIAGTNGDNDDDEDEEDLGGWNLEIDDDDDNESSVRLDLGYVGCPLSVESSCRVASLASELYACEKPVHELSVTWAGEQAIRLVAHRGNRDADVLADIDNVVQGQTVTVSGLEDAGSSSTWEIFVAGTELKLGESRFHLECGDVEMNGPEDCGLPQGNDKDNKSDLVNDWRLEGIVDDSGELRCTQAEASTSECQLQGQWADCKMLDKVRHLTFVYSGGGCAASDHAQPDKFQCSGDIDASEAITVTLESGESFPVEPGAAFTIPRDGGDTDIEIANTAGTEALRIHTSCSEPLAAGDQFGSLTLVAINGLGLGAPVDYDYVLRNKKNQALTAITREAPTRTLYQQSHTLPPASTRTVSGSAWVMASGVNALLAESDESTNAACGGADYVGVVVTPPSPCEISGSGLHSKDKEIRWTLSNTSDTYAAVDHIELNWPGNVTDKLKEMKLDGDKFFDQDRTGSSALIARPDLEGDYDKRIVEAGSSRLLKIIFDDEIEDASLAGFQMRVHFTQGCYIEWISGEWQEPAP